MRKTIHNHVEGVADEKHVKEVEKILFIRTREATNLPPPQPANRTAKSMTDLGFPVAHLVTARSYGLATISDNCSIISESTFGGRITTASQVLLPALHYLGGAGAAAALGSAGFGAGAGAAALGSAGFGAGAGAAALGSAGFGAGAGAAALGSAGFGAGAGVATLDSAGFAGAAFLASFLAQPPRIRADTSRIAIIMEINLFIVIPFH